ncbi:MAG: hypothetical protein IPH34_04945 [Chitinophagaceae bacterium]|mgnify:CR=1 FL=1|nr:hypothetical protein [Chitinophagaceae bacterium]
MKYTVRPSLYSEALESWVWLSNNNLSGFIKITNSSNNKTVYTYKRNFDDNFIKKYNDSDNTFKINNKENYIILNEYYREKLQVEKHNDVQLLIKKQNWVDIFFKNNWNNPNPLIQNTVRVSVISLFIGLIALLLTVFQFFIKE